MKTSTVLSVAALLVGALLLPVNALAHGNGADHAAHDQRRQADHTRHEQGISWQADRQIHAQERQVHRAQHQQLPYNNGNVGYQTYGGVSPYVGNGYYNGYSQTGIRGRLQNWLGGTAGGYGTNNGYYGNAYAPSATNGYVGGSAYSGQTVNGHTYTADGHRLDHHGNHDDGPGDN